MKKILLFAALVPLMLSAELKRPKAAKGQDAHGGVRAAQNAEKPAAGKVVGDGVEEERIPIADEIRNLFIQNKIVARCEFLVEKGNVPLDLMVVGSPTPEQALIKGCDLCREGETCRVVSCYSLIGEKRVELNVPAAAIPIACRDTKGEARFRLELLLKLAAAKKPDAVKQFQAEHKAQLGTERDNAADRATLKKVEEAVARIEQLRTEQFKEEQVSRKRAVEQAEVNQFNARLNAQYEAESREWDAFVAAFKAKIDREEDENRPGIGAVGAKNADFGEYVRPGLGGGLGVVLSSFRGGAAAILKYKHGSINIPLHLRAFANDLGR